MYASVFCLRPLTKSSYSLFPEPHSFVLFPTANLLYKSTPLMASLKKSLCDTFRFTFLMGLASTTCNCMYNCLAVCLVLSLNKIYPYRHYLPPPLHTLNKEWLYNADYAKNHFCLTHRFFYLHKTFLSFILPDRQRQYLKKRRKKRKHALEQKTRANFKRKRQESTLSIMF